MKEACDMNVLVTGAKGMVGQVLCANLKNIRDGKNHTRPELKIEEIYEYDIDSTEAELEEYCQKADFVFNLAGAVEFHSGDSDRQIRRVGLRKVEARGRGAVLPLRRRERCEGCCIPLSEPDGAQPS